MPRRYRTREGIEYYDEWKKRADEPFPKWLRRIRNETLDEDGHPITQNEFVERLNGALPRGVKAPRSLSGWENGSASTILRPEYINALAKVTGRSRTEVLSLFGIDISPAEEEYTDKERELILTFRKLAPESMDLIVALCEREALRRPVVNSPTRGSDH